MKLTTKELVKALTPFRSEAEVERLQAALKEGNKWKVVLQKRTRKKVIVTTCPHDDRINILIQGVPHQRCEVCGEVWETEDLNDD